MGIDKVKLPVCRVSLFDKSHAKQFANACGKRVACHCH